eukprot:1168287-Rhodomonas_salina.2
MSGANLLSSNTTGTTTTTTRNRHGSDLESAELPGCRRPGRNQARCGFRIQGPESKFWISQMNSTFLFRFRFTFDGMNSVQRPGNKIARVQPSLPFHDLHARP